MPFIKPTVGRVVHYYPDDYDKTADGGNVAGSGPLAALVVCVHSDRLVNLTVLDANGVTHARTSVTLVQDGDAVPSGRRCEWMPYQHGQAQKTDELSEKLKVLQGEQRKMNAVGADVAANPGKPLGAPPGPVDQGDTAAPHPGTVPAVGMNDAIASLDPPEAPASSWLKPKPKS